MRAIDYLLEAFDKLGIRCVHPPPEYNHILYIPGTRIRYIECVITRGSLNNIETVYYFDDKGKLINFSGLE